MKRIYILLTVGLLMTACKRNSADFSFAPETPRAGEPVLFTNLSTSGEEWEWNFGDGVTSTIKSPTHTFKQPGKYTVSLKVDKKKSLSRIKNITVYDTVPSFTCADTVFSIYKDYTFTALVYNPYNYTIDYQWSFPLDENYVTCIDTVLTRSSIKLYFTRPLQEAPICLRIIVNNDTTEIRQVIEVKDRKTNSLLFRDTEGDYRQRIFSARSEKPVIDPTATEILDGAQDTAQTYNGKEFRLSDLQSQFPGIKGFHIANRKIYYRADGLWVALIDGANKVQIDTLDCPAMTLDPMDNRIYWANENGIFYMPFVGSDNNRFVTIPTQLNTFGNVTVLVADTILR